MRLVTPSARFAVLLGGALLASGCATIPWARPDHGGSVLVATDEPLTPSRDTLPPQPVVADSGAGALLGSVARLVANDGRVETTAMRPIVAPVASGCASLGGQTGAGPLEDRGVDRAGARPASGGTWFFVGLAFGGDGVLPLLYAGRCGDWLDAGAGTGSRIARLAPAAAGRDTTVLFTTSRATAPAAHSPGLLGRALGYLIGRSAPSDEAPRTAKPRAADGASASPGTARDAQSSGQKDAPKPAEPAATAAPASRTERQRSPSTGASRW